jgi:hypothetical protein
LEGYCTNHDFHDWFLWQFAALDLKSEFGYLDYTYNPRLNAHSLFPMSSTMDQPLIDLVSIPEKVIDGEDLLEIRSISDSRLCFCASRSVIVLSFIHNLMSGTNLMTQCVNSIEIPSSIEFIDGFYDFLSLQELQFASNGHLRKIEGFQGVHSLLRIESSE